MVRAPTRTVVVGTVAAVLLLAGAVIAAGCGGRDPRSDVAVVVDPSDGGARVPRSFLGLSVEWDSVLPYTGPAGRRDQALARLLTPIGRAAGSPPALRIGGDSGDQAWWNPRGLRPRPRTVLQDVGPAELNGIGWLARTLGGPVTLGLNLALDDPANARALVRAAARRLPPGALRELEIGNEPDLFTRGRSFRRDGHLHRRLVKDPHYSPVRYRQAVERYLAAFGRRPGLVVGNFAGPAWWPQLPGMLARWRGRARVVGAHLYALANCEAPTPPRSWLASSAASADRVASLAPLAATVRRAGLPLVVSELNSAACGGRPAWSDSPEAALWLTDTLFALVRLGAVRADVHTWRGAVYAPFAVRGDRATARWPRSRPRPLCPDRRGRFVIALGGAAIATLTAR